MYTSVELMYANFVFEGRKPIEKCPKPLIENVTKRVAELRAEEEAKNKNEETADE